MYDFLLTILPTQISLDASLLLIFASLITALLTTLMGVGGGVLLLGLLASFVPPLAVIPIHACVQLGANANRALILREHLDLATLKIFAPSALLGALAGAFLLIQLPSTFIQISIACFILFLCWGPKLPHVSFSPLGIGLAAGITSFVSMFIGATGPLVAAFIKQMHEDKYINLATFAASMCIQHAPKLLVFASLGFAFMDWLGLIAIMIASGMLGTHVGLKLVHTLDNRDFHRFFNLALTMLAVRLLWQAYTSLSASF
ncbi:Uncharacterized membrane protein YfcA [Allopseudospirillum japonicum]|uniref:Probable membrane transporter protein n=1 Tax=Allopseudospirillum japonicum TaxID=64971 RepID=A0A1H6QF81_9GAMM|nr:sulfite exporter TauE/SafE family protein [Allopseudospirillum japonicum]SEI37652.1 Uncharacterized membrane protein YfcA [Allopseudospirillum japonicum]